MDQLVEIIKVVGTPTREEIEAMNPNYTEFKFPQIKAHPWARVFKSKATPEAIDLMGKLLQYTPDKRVTPMHACAHTLFDELRDPNTRLPNQRPVCLCLSVHTNIHTCTRMHAYIHTYKRTHAHTHTRTQLPQLFDFTPEEVRAAGDLMRKLQPVASSGAAAGR